MRQDNDVMVKRTTQRSRKQSAKRRVSKKRSGRSRVGKKRSGRRRVGKKRVSKRSSRFHLALMKLKRMKDGQRRKALSMANDAFIRQMCTHVRRLRHARLSPALQKKLQRQKKNLRRLIRPKTSIHVKRKILSQRGGMLPLMMMALPSIAGLIGNIIGASRGN